MGWTESRLANTAVFSVSTWCSYAVAHLRIEARRGED